jgi:hypothetical protein
MHWLYPGTFHPIEPSERATINEAAFKTLLSKSSDHSGHTSWSATWEACLYARLGKKEEAMRSIERTLERFTATNLMSLHPPLVHRYNRQGCRTCFSEREESLNRLRGAPFRAKKIRGFITDDDFKVNFTRHSVYRNVLISLHDHITDDRNHSVSNGW